MKTVQDDDDLYLVRLLSAVLVVAALSVALYLLAPKGHGLQWLFICYAISALIASIDGLAGVVERSVSKRKATNAR